MPFKVAVFFAAFCKKNDALNGQVDLIVCARHGHDLMGCKSPVHYPEGYFI